MRGTILRLNRLCDSGAIWSEEGDERGFERDGMVLWLQFDYLVKGDRVQFDLDATGRAVNIERCHTVQQGK